VKTLPQKISHKTKEALARPEVRNKMETHYDKIRGKKQPEHLVNKRTETMKQTMSDKFPLDLKSIQETLDAGHSLKETAKMYNTTFVRLKNLVSEKELQYDMSKCYVNGSKKMWKKQTRTS